MANNLLSVIPRLLATGLSALRENCVMPQLVNKSYSAMAGNLGSTIDIPLPATITTAAVTPAATAPNPAGLTPTHVALPLTNWREASFFLNDSEMMQVMNGYVPMQSTDAVKQLANDVDAQILGLYTSIYGYVGTAGTTPFGNTGAATNADVAIVNQARTVLNNQLCPYDPRYCVWDPAAEGNAMNMRAFQDASWTTTGSAIIDGQLGKKLGFGHVMDQNVPVHTGGTLGTDPGDATLTSDSAEGDETVELTVAAGTATVVVGDIISFAGHDQTYVVTANATITTGGVDVSISPPLRTDVDGSVTPVAVTKRGDHVVNLAFHRDAIAFATRPLESQNYAGLGSVIQSAVDPVSGLTLRLEVRREYKRLRYSYDILWGSVVVRPQLACRIAG